MAVPVENSERLFNSLMKRSYAPSLNFAKKKLRNKQDAEEVVQQAFLKAYRAFDRYDRARPFENWFNRILSRTIIDWVRTGPKLKVLSLDMDVSRFHATGRQGELHLQLVDTALENNPEPYLMSRILDEELSAALSRLPGLLREAVLLCDVHCRSYEEVAEMTQASLATARSRIHKGRVLLRVALGAEPVPGTRRGPKKGAA